MKKYMIAICVLLLLTSGSQAEVSYSRIDAVDGSRSRHTSEEAELHQFVHLLEQALQQFDLERLAQLYYSDPDSGQPGTLPAEYQSVFDSLFGVANGLLPTVESSHYGWVNGALDWFSFTIDSVAIGKGDAEVYLSGDWVSPRSRDRSGGNYTLDLNRTGNRWHLEDLGQIADMVGDYLNHSRSRLERVAEERVIPTRSSWDDYEEWLSNTSKHLLIEREFEEGQFDRFTRTEAMDVLEERVFSCVGTPSSYHYEGDPLFENDISVAAAADPCWQRFVVADFESNYIVAKGRMGTANDINDFRMPGGLEFRGSGLLYVCDRGNDRVKVIEVDPSSNDIVYLDWMITDQGLDDPADLDVSMDGVVAVAEYGSNSVRVFCDHPYDPPPYVCEILPRRHYSAGSCGSIDRPISISFGRDPQTSEKSREAYVVDKDGRRILRAVDIASDIPGWFEFSSFPDPAARISSISVDNKGQVWAIDYERGKVYKFDHELRLLGIQGGEGTEMGEYLYPYGLSFSQAYQYVAEQTPPAPMPAVSEAILSEEWGEETGFRRLVAGVDIQSPSLHYSPQLQGGTPDRVDMEYFITGYADPTIVITGPPNVCDTMSSINVPPGLKEATWYPPEEAESGTFTVRIIANSIYNHGNSSVATLYVDVDRSIVNQKPVITNLYFPSGDSCFEMSLPTHLAVTVDDEDTSAIIYHWYTDPGGCGTFTDPGANPAEFSYTDAKEIPDCFIKVRVEDEYGQLSDVYTLIVDNLVIGVGGDCLIGCRVGDADGSGFVNISDATYLIAYIFSGGPAPDPLARGDADCNGIVNQSDAVYLIAYIYGGGGAPGRCCNCDTDWCD